MRFFKIQQTYPRFIPKGEYLEAWKAINKENGYEYWIKLFSQPQQYIVEVIKDGKIVYNSQQHSSKAFDKRKEAVHFINNSSSLQNYINTLSGNKNLSLFLGLLSEYGITIDLFLKLYTYYENMPHNQELENILQSLRKI